MERHQRHRTACRRSPQRPWPPLTRWTLPIALTLLVAPVAWGQSAAASNESAASNERAAPNESAASNQNAAAEVQAPAATDQPIAPGRPAGPTTPLTASPEGALDAAPSGDPAAQCYEQARKDGSDAYVCDLAVQMARSSAPGSRNRTLAAALNNRALVLADDGRLEPALEDLDAALAQTPEDAGLHGNRGNLLLRLGRPVDALQAHDRAVALAGDDPVGYFNRAFSYLALGDRAAAQRDVETARALLTDGAVPQHGGTGLTPRSIPAGPGDPGP